MSGQIPEIRVRKSVVSTPCRCLIWHWRRDPEALVQISRQGRTIGPHELRWIIWVQLLIDYGAEETICRTGVA